MHITIVNSESGDWTGLYINGKIKDQGHSISLRNFMEYLSKDGYPITIDSFRTLYAHEDWMEEMARLPDNLKDVILENEEYPIKGYVKCARCKSPMIAEEGMTHIFYGLICEDCVNELQ